MNPILKGLACVGLGLVLQHSAPAYSQVSDRDIERFQVVLTPDPALKGRGVRGLRIDKLTGASWSLVSAGNASVAWKPFGSDPSTVANAARPTRNLQLISVADDPARGVRSMLLDTKTGETWWHETVSGQEQWVSIGTVK